MTQSYDLTALKATYDADGVVKVPRLVSADWLERLTVALTEFMKDDPGEGNSVNFGHGPGRTTVRWMWRTMPDVLAFGKDQHIGSVVGAVTGAKHLMFWYDNTFIQDPGHKEAFQAGSPWHHDAAAFPFKGEQNPSLWVALTPVTEDTAPLTCLKGSHRTGVLYRPSVYVDQKAALPEGFVDQPDFDAAIAAGEWETVWFPMEPGDALLIHPNTVHGAPPAADGAPRRVGFTSRWAGDDIRWWIHDFAMRIPGMDFADVKDGTAPEGELFPVVWRSDPTA